jgi:hypothetical protein
MVAEAVGSAVGDRPEQVVVAGHADDDVMLTGGLGFGEADSAVFGVGEAAAGDHLVGGPAGGSQNSVGGGDAAFHPGSLDQHGVAGDVTGCVDVPDVGA